MRRLFVGIVVSACAAVLSPVILPASPAFAACPEYNKFVYDPNHTFSAGNMGVLKVENNQRDGCTAKAIAHTVFVDLSNLRGLTFVEAGLREDSFNPGYSTLYWAYQLNGGSEVYFDGDFGYPAFTPGQYVSFAITPTTGLATTWKWQYAAGTSESGWLSLGSQTPDLGAYAGDVEGEVSPKGTSGAIHHEQQLRYRSTAGGFFNWTNITCDPNSNSVTNYDAVKSSPNSWYTQAGTPIGAC